MSWEYSDKTKKLFLDAVRGKPGTHLGEITDPDGVGKHGSIACGDAMQFAFQVKRHPTDPTKDIITEAKYLTFGCTSAIAASEALCYLIEDKGLTPIQALKITNQDIVEYLEGLPTQKIHCSVMGAEALEAAVLNWASRRGVDSSTWLAHSEEEQEEGRIVCDCFSLSEPYIKRQIEELALKDIPAITGAIKAGGACSSCHHVPGGLQDLLDEVWGDQSESVSEPELPVPDSDSPGLSPYQLGKKIDSVVEEHIRPLLKADGGDLRLLDVKGNLIYCQMEGACAGCAGASQTLKLTVERILKDQVDESLKVIAV